ncbi:Tat pathway signal sequence domain protein [Streptomyces sp. TRM66268-LWL]|uniref:Tat pathway signal sequence domain protein n=1 Tax=Streptomyces polyasparticus TaxID=2767826 RepID=A0ABR7S674_9ACTN|nr:DUF6250 domain-containing protein [Streptomyces polyasparticus]MBC9710985.1 Tat pathway signal sequence domain protein [Streptomyces polyasparticus]
MSTSRRAFAALAAGVALAALDPAGAAAGSRRGRRLLARDGFRHGLGQWAVELEAGGTVTATGGVLEVDTPAGATIWFKRKLPASYEITYTATPVSAGGANDRVSDLNNFWNASDVRSPHDLFATPRTGAFADCDFLKMYYAGFGANYNTTTRLRRYVGEPGVRPLLFDYTAPLLTPNAPHHVRLVSDGPRQEWWLGGVRIFAYEDPAPYLGGHFAFRTTWSHFAFRDFEVRGL